MDKQLLEIVGAADCIRCAVNRAKIGELDAETFRIFIYNCNRGLEIPHEVLKEVSTNLLSVLSSACLEKDCQIVAATAYCSVQVYLYHEDSALLFDHLLKIINNENYEKCKLHICNGITHLNTKNFTETLSKSPENRNALVGKILEIVESECNKLNATTYLAFDTFNEILSIILEIRKGDYPVPPECLKPLLRVVTSNFENPMPGVRQKNLKILQKLMCFYDDVWEEIIPKISSLKGSGGGNRIEYQSLLDLVMIYLPWTMKTKYFILKIIVENSARGVLQEYGEQIVQGLILSLSSPHLVSAGTDLYKQLLSVSQTEWIDFFFEPISCIMSDPSVSLFLENLFNYWLEHTFSILPELLDYLLKEVTYINLYSYISLLKISRKEGFKSFDWEKVDKQKLEFTLENVSDKIRSQAFSFICTTKRTSELPSKEEFEAVHKFLKQNVNSDNAAFRHSLLSSFTNFIIRIRDSILSVQKHNQLELDVSLKHCFSFFDWLHSFFIFNLEDTCNYQRKITTLELYTVFLTYFGEPVDGMVYARKSNKKHLSLKNITGSSSWLYVFESELYQKTLLKCLLDEDSDVRDCSAKIILKHLVRNDILAVEDFENLYQKGILLCSSQIFYKAESGALIIKVLVTLAHNSSLESFKHFIHNKRRSFLDELISSAEAQFCNLQNDLLKAASEGSFLYGHLQAIKLLGTADGPETAISSTNQDRLLVFLEEAVNFFISVLSSKSNCNLDYAPSFGEMGEAILALVDKSSVKESQANDDDGNILAAESGIDLHLTPAQQLVLNCIWLNLKESSMLCYELVKMKRLTDCLFTERCVLLVVSILRRCRHKGAIEAAGLAFSKIINCITKTVPKTPNKENDSRCSHLPEKLLETFLSSLVKSSTTVSRRSAGLAIMVHKLVAGDARISKPLLPRCVTTLLALAREECSECDSNSLVDLPQGQAMHLLRALVQDSGLKQNLLPYYTDICMVSLANMASPVWTIRNAALQLFGAFVPKLVGQKSQQGEGKGSQYLMFEQLYAHAKPVVDLLLCEFSQAADSNSTVSHAKLMPILALVTNVNVGLERILVEDVSKIVAKFQNYFQQLFNSRIYNVRKLSAKAHAQFLSVLEIIPTVFQRVNEIMGFLTEQESAIRSDNELHGYLLNVTYLIKRYDEEKFGMKLLLEEEKRLNERVSDLSKAVLSCRQSYFIKSLVFEWKRLTFFDCDIPKMYKSIAEIPIGFSHFLDKELSLKILSLKGEELEQAVQFCLLKCSWYDVQFSCVNALKKKFKSKCELKGCIYETYHTLFVILKEFMLKCNYIRLVSVTIEVMFYIIEMVNISSSTFYCEKFILYSEETFSSNKSSCSVLTFLLPVVCGMLSSYKPIESIDLDCVQKVAVWIKDRCDSDFDQDTRINAVKAMILLIPVLKTGKIKETMIGELIWEACIDFLQDELSEIRCETSRFVTNFEDLSNVMNPFISMEYMFISTNITKFILPEKALQCLWRRMVCISDKRSALEGVKNPFNHGESNIFAEQSVVSNMAYHCLLEFMKSPDKNLKLRLKGLCIDFKCKEMFPFLSNYVKNIECCINADIKG